MLWVWPMIVGSLALASYLWMRIDEAQKPAAKARRGAGERTAQSASGEATRSS